MGTEQAGGFYIPDLGQGLVIKRSKLGEGAKAEMMTRVKEEKKLLIQHCIPMVASYVINLIKAPFD